MCGIFGYVGVGNATQKVFEGLKQLEYRGYDSWGIVSVSKKGLVTEKYVGKIGRAKLTLPPSPVSLGHTRWATHGGVTTENAHPHLDCTGGIAVVHNGIIENYEELKKKLERKGHRFASTTDTEVFAHLVEEAMKGSSFVSAVRQSFTQIKGLNTLAVMNQDGTLVAGKNGSPLIIGKDQDGNLYLSSDIPSLLESTHTISIVKDGEVLVIKDGKLRTNHRFEEITMDAETVEKGPYTHFLAKEIADQPGALARVGVADQVVIQKAQKMIHRAKQLYGIGCGTAYNSMQVAAYLFARYGKRQVIPVSANEFSAFVSCLNKQTLVIMASQSGETMDTIEAMRQAKKQGAKTLAFVNVPGSTLAREVDVAIPLLAGVERAVVSTKAFTNMVAATLLLLGKNRLVREASNGMKKMLPHVEKDVRKLVPKLVAQQHIFLVGREVNYPIAIEGALKLKETAYLHAEGFAGGELKHGVIALIEKGTPCIVIVSEDKEEAATLSGAMELKARGAWIIGIGPKKESVFDDWIAVPNHEDISPILNIIPLQVLGYQLAIAKKLDPDMPRNLAKSVTVK